MGQSGKCSIFALRSLGETNIYVNAIKLMPDGSGRDPRSVRSANRSCAAAGQERRQWESTLTRKRNYAWKPLPAIAEASWVEYWLSAADAPRNR